MYLEDRIVRLQLWSVAALAVATVAGFRVTTSRPAEAQLAGTRGTHMATDWVSCMWFLLQICALVWWCVTLQGHGRPGALPQSDPQLHPRLVRRRRRLRRHQSVKEDRGGQRNAVQPGAARRGGWGHQMEGGRQLGKQLHLQQPRMQLSSIIVITAIIHLRLHPTGFAGAHPHCVPLPCFLCSRTMIYLFFFLFILQIAPHF